jgi:hypothetical protein
MNSTAPQPVSLTFNPSFWDVFIASITLMRYQGMLVCLHAIFPLAGLFILLLPYYVGRRLEAEHVLIAMLAFLFTPLVTALTVWSVRRRNKLARGPFTFTLDSNGIHTRSTAFTQTIQWAGILKTRRSKTFLFIFVSPTRAISIPLKALREQGILEEVVSLVRQHTDFK